MKQELELYLVAMEKDRKEKKVKSSILLSYIGPQSREIYNTFAFSQEEENFDHNVIVQKFEKFCIPRQNITLLRYKFLTYKQDEGQSFDEFMTQLKRLSSDCEFGELKNIVVIGVTDDSLRERMLREPNLTLERATALGQSAEQTKIHVKELKQEAEIYGIKFSKKESRYSQAAKKIKQCKYCGKTHIRGACPAFHQTCNKCHKKGHFANVCMSTNKHLNYLDNQNTPLTTAEETLDEDNFFIGAIFDNSNGVINNNQQINTIAEETIAKWSVTLNINRTNNDSGAQVNVLPENQIETLQRKPRITKSTTILSAYNGSNIPIKGQCTLDIHHRGKNVPLLFIVVDTNSLPIIRLNSSKQLNLIKRILSISNSQKRNFLNEYKDCFGEIGTLPKVHHITIDQNIIPVVTPARKIPIALLDKLKLELERMRRLDIIEPVNDPTEWVNPLIIVEKTNGKLRICLDPKHLNQAIKRQHYKLPTAEELFSEMHHAIFFYRIRC